jgi:hypothetical protein
MKLTKEISDNKGVFIQIYDMAQATESSFPTPSTFALQVGFAFNEDAKVYQPHIHTDIERTTRGTAEFIYIISGRMNVTFLDEEAQACGEAELTAQMALLQLRGGHAIKTAPGTSFFEIKQGPYLGRDADKFIVNNLTNK